MNTLRFAIPCALLAVACSASKERTTTAPPPSSLLITGAKIFGHPDSEAVFAKDGVVVSVGKHDALAAQAGSGAAIIDARGAHVLPGFHDGHAHLMGGGMGSLGPDVSEMQTMEAALKAIKTFAETHQNEPWIVGRGWQYGIVPPGQFPTRQQLDSAVSDRPVFLRSYDGHSGWANSKALAAAGIDASIADPPDGKFVREADNETPQGALLEGAMAKMDEAVPRPGREAKKRALETALQHYVDNGYTAATDIVFDQEELAIYADLETRGQLPIRISIALPLDGELDAYEKLRTRHKSPMLSIAYLKGFVDGVIESKTAYVLEPFEGSTERGKPFIEPAKLDELVDRAHARGFPVGLHSIGDAAVRMALDAYEKAQHKHPAIKLRHRVEHIEVIDPADVPRFAKLGVVASMQPFHSNPGGPNPDDGVWSRNLGAQRLKMTFAWKSLLEAGTTLAFGSDWPVMSANPLWGLAVATTRRDPNGQPAGGWNAHQAVGIDAAIRAFSQGSAFAVGREDRVGVITPGQWADLVILSRDVSLDDPKTLWKGSVTHVVVGGRLVRVPK